MNLWCMLINSGKLRSLLQTELMQRSLRRPIEATLMHREPRKVLFLQYVFADEVLISPKLS